MTGVGGFESLLRHHEKAVCFPVKASMQFSTRITGRRACRALLGPAAGVVIGWGAALAQQPNRSPAEIVAFRFPLEWSSAPAMPLLVAQGRSFEQQTTAKPSFNSYAHPPGLPSPWTDALAHARARPAASTVNGNSFFNEAQIASLKDRLKLTREQERYWPAVAEALRVVAYRKRRDGGAVIDPDSVQGLSLAARELIKYLNETQKREVETLAHLVGLKNQL
jgi:hypothetical protein